MQRMDSWLASDTDALQLGTRFGAPGGRALPLLLNHVCICVIRVIRGEVLLRREGGDDFFEVRIAAQRIPVRIEKQLAVGCARRDLR
jgi:hypothetical protein